MAPLFIKGGVIEKQAERSRKESMLPHFWFSQSHFSHKPPCDPACFLMKWPQNYCWLCDNTRPLMSRATSPCWCVWVSGCLQVWISVCSAGCVSLFWQVLMSERVWMIADLCLLLMKSFVQLWLANQSNSSFHITHNPFLHSAGGGLQCDTCSCVHKNRQDERSQTGKNSFELPTLLNGLTTHTVVITHWSQC